MSSPETISLQVPYVEDEREFLVLAVQIAVRTFRRMKVPCSDTASPSQSTSTPPSNDVREQTQGALNER